MTTSSEVLLDTNVVLRYLLDDHPRMAEEARRLIARAEAGAFDLHVTHLLLAEAVWVLTSRRYSQPRHQVMTSLLAFIDLRSIRVDQKEVVRRALIIFASSNIDFIDAYHVAEGERRGLAICSYDRDFDRLGANRVEPGALVGAS